MAYNGNVRQFPAPWCQGGVGIIDSEEVGEVTFSLRELLNGGPENLEPGRQLKFGLVNGRATNVCLRSVKTYKGTIEAQADEPDNWIIKEDDTDQLVWMHYDRIFKGLPSIIAPGERVSYTRHPKGNTAFNIRFPELVPLTGTIKNYFQRTGKGFVNPDGWGEDVIFHKAAFTNEPTIHVGMRVTFDLERACPMKLRTSGMHSSQATRMRVNLVGIQEVEHPDAPPRELPNFSENPRREPFVPEDTDLPDDFASHDSFEPLQLIRITFSRNPEPLHNILQDSMSENGGVRLPGGAYLIAPCMYHDMIREQVAGKGLGCGDVIVTEELEESLLANVRSIPRKFKISEQRRETIAIDVPQTWEDLAERVEEQRQAAEDMEGENQSSEGMLPIHVGFERTFIHVMLPSSMFSAPSGGPRTESDRPRTEFDRASMTTETPGSRNPRSTIPRNRVLPSGVSTLDGWQ
mmetsp:Transcript_47370/g.88217  ORF Transcript_47370/g.88217 Transcript_47370/m.88217 type:complete len:462 (-) Transcript_47370:55-1440(-)